MKRNRVKRWLREIVRREGRSLAGVDVVFIARTASVDAGLTALKREVSRAFGQMETAR